MTFMNRRSILVDKDSKGKSAMELTKISKKMSYMLRHCTDPFYIDLNGGWADVNKIIRALKERYPDVTRSVVEQIVAQDEKGRYSFNDSGTKIRANQGHSIAVDVELEKKTPPAVLYHGTGEKYASSIDEQGLIPKSRLYVHLSSDVETAKKVGSRHGKPVVYTVDCAAMTADGYQFYLSANNVWLTKEVPIHYLNKM